MKEFNFVEKIKEDEEIQILLKQYPKCMQRLFDCFDKRDKEFIKELKGFIKYYRKYLNVSEKDRIRILEKIDKLAGEELIK